MVTPTAPRHVRSAVPLVRVDGRWLTEAQSARINDLIDSA
jgi:hypothetical protein